MDNLENKEFDEIRKMFANFYSVLKDSESMIKFCFITGITRISHVSIFSKLNNLVNISDWIEYASLCGFTEDELDKYYTPYFEQIYERNNLNSLQDKLIYRKKVKDYYDGYRFSPYSDTLVYNPVSIGSFLQINSSNNIGFQNYWIDTGGMSTIRNLVKARIEDLDSKQPWLVSLADRSLMEVANIFEKSTPKEYIYAYLFQCGYLTIKDVDEEGKLNLIYPNEEVASSLGSLIINFKYGSSIEPVFITKLRNAFLCEDANSIVSSLNSLYSSLPWQTNPKANEGPFEGVLLTLLYSINFSDQVVAEESTSGGVSDVVLRINSNLIYIFELKVEEDAKKALSQIKEKKYYQKYIKENSRIHLLGLNFPLIWK